MDRVLVTGACSFTARHLLPLLAAGGPAALLATDLPGAGPPGTRYLPADLTDRAGARALLAEARPDVVFHLAAVGGADPDRCYAVNLDGTRNLLEACAALPVPPRVLVVSSAAVYGLTRPEESPVREDTPLRPATAYGASKAAAELFALALHRRGRLRVAVARPFNLVGPGLRAGFAPSDFMTQALAIRAGAPPEIRVGALEPRRDFVDARDAARAYAALAGAEGAWGAAWNVASGRPVAIGDLLERVLRAAGARARVVPDPARLGRVEVMDQVGDPARLEQLTGWRADTALDVSLRDMAAEG